MTATIELEKNMKIIGTTPAGHKTYFDTTEASGGNDSAATPMEITLQAAAACSMMDVAAILKKKKKTVEELKIKIDGVQADTYPKVFTKIKMFYELKSPDAELKDLDRAIELSQSTYCSVSAMLKSSGCEIKWESKLI